MTSERLDQRLPAARADRVPRGILFMLGATVMYAGSTALSKWQVASYPFPEVLFFRTFVSLIVVSLLILPRHGFAVFRTQRLRDHAGRSATQTVAQSLILIATAPAIGIRLSAIRIRLCATVWVALRPA